MREIAVHFHEDLVRGVLESPQHQGPQGTSALVSSHRLLAADQVETLPWLAHTFANILDRAIGTSVVEDADRKTVALKRSFDPVEKRTDIGNLIKHREQNEHAGLDCGRRRM